MREVILEQRESLPKPSWDLPSDELYIRIGCAGCSKAVHFAAKGYTLKLHDSEEAKDLRDLVGEVEKGSKVDRASLSRWEEPCELVDGACPDTETIDLVVELLNERFDAQLSAPEPTHI